MLRLCPECMCTIDGTLEEEARAGLQAIFHVSFADNVFLHIGDMDLKTKELRSSHRGQPAQWTATLWWGYGLGRQQPQRRSGVEGWQ